MRLLRSLIPPNVRPASVATLSRLREKNETLCSRLNAQERELYTLKKAILAVARGPVRDVSRLQPFNGQDRRREIFDDLVCRCGIASLVETGTFTGETTAYMALLGNRPVWSSEVDPCLHAVATARLSELASISLQLGDSRSLLRQLAASPACSGRVFFYLDAHWYDDLPLGEELNIIGKGWRDAVIMVDDFKVPGDDGYRYDDYGVNKVLSLECNAEQLASNGFVPFFPVASSKEETGDKRGCVVLAKGESVIREVEQSQYVRRFASH